MFRLKNKLAARKLTLVFVSLAAVFALVFGFVMGTKQTVVAGSLTPYTALRVDTAGDNISKKFSNELYAQTLPLRYGSEYGAYTYVQDDERGFMDVRLNDQLKSQDDFFNQQQSTRRFVLTYNVSTETTPLLDGAATSVFASYDAKNKLTINVDPLNGGQTKIDYTKVGSASAIADLWLDKATFNAIVDHYYGNTNAWRYIQAEGVANDPSFTMPTPLELQNVRKLMAITGKKDNNSPLTAAEYRNIAIAWPEMSSRFLINSSPVDSSLLTNSTATTIILNGLSDTNHLVNAINFPIFGTQPRFHSSFPGIGASYETALGVSSKSFIIIVTVVGLIIIASFLVWWYRVIGLVASLAIAMYLAILLAIMGAANINVDVPTLLAASAGFLMLLKLIVDQMQAISNQITAGLSTKEAFRQSIKRRFITTLDYMVVIVIAGLCFALMGKEQTSQFGITLMIGAGVVGLSALVYSTWMWLTMDNWIVMSRYAFTGAWRNEFQCPSQQATKKSKALAYNAIGVPVVLSFLIGIAIAGIIVATAVASPYADSLQQYTSFYLIANKPVDPSLIPGGYVAYHEVLTIRKTLDVWSTLTDNQIHVYIINTDQQVTSAFADDFLTKNAVYQTAVSDRGNSLRDFINQQFAITQFSSWTRPQDVSAVLQVNDAAKVSGTAVGGILAYMLVRNGLFFGLPAMITFALQSAVVFGLIVITRIGLSPAVAMGFIMLALVNYASINSAISIGSNYARKSVSMSREQAIDAMKSINAEKIREDYKNYLAFLLISIGAMLLKDNLEGIFGVLIAGAFFSLAANYYALSNLLVYGLTVRSLWVNRKLGKQRDLVDEQLVVGINS